MSYAHYIDNLLFIIDLVYNSVISYSDAPIILRARELAAISWSRILIQTFNGGNNSVKMLG